MFFEWNWGTNLIFLKNLESFEFFSGYPSWILQKLYFRAFIFLSIKHSMSHAFYRRSTRYITFFWGWDLVIYRYILCQAKKYLAFLFAKWRRNCQKTLEGADYTQPPLQLWYRCKPIFPLTYAIGKQMVVPQLRRAFTNLNNKE